MGTLAMKWVRMSGNDYTDFKDLKTEAAEDI